MNLRCWNCGTEEADLERAECGFCGELLKPDSDQRARSLDRIQYLIRELKRWKSVPEWWKREAEENYQKRQRTLETFPEEGLLVESRPKRQPKIATPPTAPPPRPQPDENPWIVQPPVEVEPVAPAAPTEADVAMHMLMGAFSEKKIRLLYALGGVLLLASGVGILRSSWEGWGRQVMALLLTFMPGLFFWLARQLREKLPISSRMFTVLGGAMLPVGVLFLNTFNVGGLEAPAWLWNPLSFTIGWAVNHRLAKRASEPICAYLAGLCWVLAAWASSSGLVLGLGGFFGAAMLFWKEKGDPHWQRVAHGLSLVGLLAAFTRGPLESGTAATLFLLAMVYFTTSAWLRNTPLAMVSSSLICLVCAGWLGSLLEWPHAGIGLAALLQAALYLDRGPTGQRLAIYLTAAVFVIFLGLPMLAHIPTNFAEVPVSQLLTCAATGALGAAFYGFAAYRHRRPLWVYGATLCSLYSYFSLLALMMREQPALYRPWLVGLAVVWQLAVTFLRRRVPESYLRPWVWTAAGLSLLLVPLNLVMQMAGADVYTPWIYLGVAGVTTLSALFEHDPRGLYVSMITAALAYASWLPVILGPSQEPNLGLAFTAFVAALALGGLALRNSPYGKPLLVSAAVAGWGFSALQLVYLQMGYWNTAATALIFYGVGFALVRQRYASLHSGLCLLTALSCWDHMQVGGVGTALLACATLIALAPAGYLEAALLWSAVAAVLGPASLKIFPALLWLGASLRPSQLAENDRQRLAEAASLLLLPALPGCWKAWPNAGLAVATAVQIWLGLKWQKDSLLNLAWLQLKAVYLCAFGFDNPLGWTTVLWLEWAALARLGRLPALESLSTLTLLLLSWFHQGWMAVVNPWAVVGVMLMRNLQTGRKEFDVLCHAGVVWASFSSAWMADNHLLFPLLMFAFSYVDAFLGKRDHLKFISFLGWLGCWGGGDTMAFTFTLAVGAGAWGLLATTDRTALWGVFGLLYHAYVVLLLNAQVGTVELYTVPLALWFLAWGTLFSESAAFRQLGLGTLLLPSMLLSLGSVSHALWAGSLGLGLIVLGQSTGRGSYQAWGALAILSEVALQAVMIARNLPWHQWAVVGGILLVSMAFLVERRREEVVAASRRFLHHLNAV